MNALTLCDSNRLTEVVSQCHQRLDDLFLLHQEAVLLGRFGKALQLLNCFKELHHLHMRFEDEKLIPKLDGIDDRGRWPASLYTDEHAKVRDLMGKTENNLRSLGKGQLSSKELRRQIIVFLDEEKTFKGLREHHQEREEAGMLLELDNQTGNNWRVSTIKPFMNAWSDCMERNMAIVNGVELP